MQQVPPELPVFDSQLLSARLSCGSKRSAASIMQNTIFLGRNAGGIGYEKTALLHLAGRGLDFGVPRLYVLDGSKALRAAVRRHVGEAAFVQRCQVHKRSRPAGCSTTSRKNTARG